MASALTTPPWSGHETPLLQVLRQTAGVSLAHRLARVAPKPWMQAGSQRLRKPSQLNQLLAQVLSSASRLGQRPI